MQAKEGMPGCVPVTDTIVDANYSVSPDQPLAAELTKVVPKQCMDVEPLLQTEKHVDELTASHSNFDNF